MAILTLVRHGQASYMSEDYDRLSPLGERQARKLGEFWVKHRITFDAVMHGPAQRHVRTMELAGEVVRDAGLPWPEAQRVSDFDEFDAFQMMKRLLPVLLESDPDLRALHGDFLQHQHGPEGGQKLQKLFEAACRHWCAGALAVEGIETWQEFRLRVAKAVDAIRRSAKSSTHTVVFTSGGPIACTVAQCLDLAPPVAVEFLWLSRNAGFAEFLFSNGRFSMHSFNSIPHLDHRELLSYR
jgi:broad specificity phosphatase PhoE